MSSMEISDCPFCKGLRNLGSYYFRLYGSIRLFYVTYFWSMTSLDPFRAREL